LIAITDAVGIGILIAAISGGIVSIIGAIFAGIAMLRGGRVDKKVDQVDKKVDTFNELSLGQLSGRAETRRIDEIKPEDRTDQEDRHMAMDVLDPDTETQRKESP
jgi:hypothetical protein